MMKYASDFILKIHKIPGIKYSEENNSSEDFSRPAVIICNHQSHLDLAPLLSLTPKMIILTADWVWKNPLYSYLIRHAEFLPASSGVEALMPKLKSLVERGYSIAVFPEGTRSLDCSIGRFHQGAFYLAEKLNLDILPVILYGSGKALPKHGRKLNKWNMHLEIDERITPEQMKEYGESTREQASALRKYYKKRYREIADRIEQNL